MKNTRHILCLTVFFCVLLPTVKSQYYKNLNDVFSSSSVSSNFGFNKGYTPKNALTLYRVDPPTNDNTDDLTQAWFEVSNNNISCSINANGLVEYPSVMGPLSGYEQGSSKMSSKVYSSGDYITGSQWTFSINDGKNSALLSNLENPSLDIIDNIFYKWKYTFNNLDIQILFFAPEADENPLIPEPRALIAVVNIKNNRDANVNGKISTANFISDASKINSEIPKAISYGLAALPVADSHKGNRANFHPKYAEVAPTVAGYEAVMLLDSKISKSGLPDVSFSLKSGESVNLPFAFLVGAGVDELKHTREFVGSKSVIDWLNLTAKIHKKPTGELIIPEDPMLVEMFYRYYECGHACYLLNGNGVLSEPKGGSWSLMSLMNPGYIKGSIQNLARVSDMVPFHASTIKSDVSFSLYGSTQELIMAADYYQRSGDKEYFINKSFQKNATKIISNILATQYPEATLFPSKNIWDGPSRGDYHTGSQILVWRVLDIFSKIARQEWNDNELADKWSEKAKACKSDILSKCVIPGPFGPQFAEGTWKNGVVDSTAKCHDGEEVALVQSAFYGLTEQDSPLVTNHCRASMTSFNPLYKDSLNAMMWQDATYFNYGYTFPAWLVLIAGATTNEALLSGINLWKSMTDLDGSPWWWPYDADQTNPAVVNRRKSNFKGGFCDVAKVPYATSVFNTLLINNILGLAADIPQKKVTFRPFSPWKKFEWKNGRIGNAFFDIKYTDSGSDITAEITNRNPDVYTGIIGITAPKNKKILEINNGKKRYERDYVEFEKQLKPNQTEIITIQYDSVNTIGSVLSNLSQPITEAFR